MRVLEEIRARQWGRERKIVVCDVDGAALCQNVTAIFRICAKFTFFFAYTCKLQHNQSAPPFVAAACFAWTNKHLAVRYREL